MATYHISNYGSLAARALRADLDGYVYTTADEVLGGRWDTGGEDMDAAYAEEIAAANRAAVEESERAIARWRGTPTSLDDLLALMRADDSSLGDWTSLPTFGGEEPAHTRGVWSWDDTRMIVGTCPDDVEIVSRDAAD